MKRAMRESFTQEHSLGGEFHLTAENQFRQMKTIICCLFLLLATEAARAQSEDAQPTVKHNTVFVELGGPVAAYSINYDRRLRSSSFV